MAERMTCYFKLFVTISVILGQWDNESLCAMELSFMAEKILPPARLEPRTARLAGQRLTYRATGDSNNMSYSSFCSASFNQTNHVLTHCILVDSDTVIC